MDIEAEPSDQKAQFNQGYLYALRLLAVTRRSSEELSDRLKKKGYPPAVAQRVVDQLGANRILDDQKLTREIVDSAVSLKRLGRRRIAFELRRKGIKPSAVDQALASYSIEQERSSAEAIACERWEQLKNIEPKKRIKRVYDYLAARGFSYELCREVVSELKDEREHDVI